MVSGDTIGGRFVVTNHFEQRWYERSLISITYFDLVIKHNAYLRLYKDDKGKCHNMFYCSETKQYYIFITRDERLVTFQTEQIYSRMMHAVPMNPNKEKLQNHLRRIKMFVGSPKEYSPRNWFTVSVFNGNSETKLPKIYWSEVSDYTDTLSIESNLDTIISDLWNNQRFIDKFVTLLCGTHSSEMTYIIRAFNKEYHCKIDQTTEEI